MSYFKFYALVLVFVSGIGFTSCSNTEVVEENNTLKNDTITSITRSCDVLYKDAKTIDSVLMKTTSLQKDLAVRAINTFSVFATQCKNDSLAPIFLIKAGQVAQSIGNYQQAESLFKTCSTEFPNFRNRGAVLFLLAQLYDDSKMLNNEAEAKKLYEEIIKTYPKTAWERDAKASIQNLGKTDEQLIQEFLKKNK